MLKIAQNALSAVASASALKSNQEPAILLLLTPLLWVDGAKSKSAGGIAKLGYDWAHGLVGEQWQPGMAVADKYNLLKVHLSKPGQLGGIRKFINSLYPAERIQGDRVTLLSAKELIGVMQEITTNFSGASASAAAGSSAPVAIPSEGRDPSRFDGEAFKEASTCCRYVATLQAAGALFCELYNGASLDNFRAKAQELSEGLFSAPRAQLSTSMLRNCVLTALQYANLTTEHVKLLCRTALVSHPSMISSFLLNTDLKNWQTYANKLTSSERKIFGGLVQADLADDNVPFRHDNDIRTVLGYAFQVGQVDARHLKHKKLVEIPDTQIKGATRLVPLPRGSKLPEHAATSAAEGHRILYAKLGHGVALVGDTSTPVPAGSRRLGCSSDPAVNFDISPTASVLGKVLKSILTTLDATMANCEIRPITKHPLSMGRYIHGPFNSEKPDATSIGGKLCTLPNDHYGCSFCGNVFKGRENVKYHFVGLNGGCLLNRDRAGGRVNPIIALEVVATREIKMGEFILVLQQAPMSLADMDGKLGGIMNTTWEGLQHCHQPPFKNSTLPYRLFPTPRFQETEQHEEALELLRQTVKGTSLAG